ncbi:RING finger protein 207-like [Saccostrea cucullata]|uniref:RING finger protein 207-like n=1 Tax=Saccostrea cuccullata TaxID=36930 RepID=UPI002ED6270C
MASGFAQHYVECTTCDSNAEYYCNTCQFDLCQACKETHQRKKKTENHEVVLYREREDKVQERCSTHSDKIYNACCKECELPVCIKCITESHSCHAIVEIEDIFNQKLEVFNKQIQDLKEKIIPQCEDVQKNISKEIENCRKTLSQIRSDLLTTAQSIKDLVDFILKEKTEKVSKLEESLMKELQSREKEMKTYTNGLNSIIEDFEDLRRTDKKAEFIIKHKEKLQIIPLQSLGTMFYTPPPSFTPCPVSKEQIEKLSGDIVEESQKPIPGTSDLHHLVHKASFFPVLK